MTDKKALPMTLHPCTKKNKDNTEKRETLIGQTQGIIKHACDMVLRNEYPIPVTDLAEEIITLVEQALSDKCDGWIIWQKACDAMQTEMIKEVEREWKRGAVITRPDLRRILEDVHHPSPPQE